MRQQSPFIWTSRVVVRIFFNQHLPFQMVVFSRCASAVSFNLLTPQSIMGLTFVGAAGAAAQSAVNTPAAGAARGGKMLRYSRRANTVTMHSDLIQIIVIIWAILMCWLHTTSGQRINTGKKAPYWAFYDELKAAVGKYSPVWRCVGCHPVAAATLALYEQKKELKAIPKGLTIRLVSSCTHPCTFLVCGADFCMYVRTHTRTHARMHACMNMRAVSNIDSLKLFATLKEAYPLIYMIRKCLLACPPSQSDCEELFSLLGLYEGIFMYVCIWCHTRIFVTKQEYNMLTYTHIYTYTQVCVLPRSKSNTWRTDSTFIVIIVYKT